MKKMFYRHTLVVSLAFSGLLALISYLLISASSNSFIYTIISISIFLAVGLILGKYLLYIHDIAYSDNLTGLKNRSFFYDIINRQIGGLNKVNSLQVCLAMIDIDNFKNINDTYGHNIGDSLLKEIAYIIKKNVRQSDYVIRWGGDEFVILMPNIDIDSTYVIAERIRIIIKDHFSCDDRYSCISISVGLTSFTNNTNIDSLIQVADTALYRAKKIKNSIVTATI